MLLEYTVFLKTLKANFVGQLVLLNNLKIDKAEMLVHPDLWLLQTPYLLYLPFQYLCKKSGIFKELDKSITDSQHYELRVCFTNFDKNLNFNFIYLVLNLVLTNNNIGFKKLIEYKFL